MLDTHYSFVAHPFPPLMALCFSPSRRLEGCACGRQRPIVPNDLAVARPHQADGLGRADACAAGVARGAEPVVLWRAWGRRGGRRGAGQGTMSRPADEGLCMRSAAQVGGAALTVWNFGYSMGPPAGRYEREHCAWRKQGTASQGVARQHVACRVLSSATRDHSCVSIGLAHSWEVWLHASNRLLQHTAPHAAFANANTRRQLHTSTALPHCTHHRATQHTPVVVPALDANAAVLPCLCPV